MKAQPQQPFCVSWERAITILPWALSALAFVIMLFTSLLLPSQLGPTPHDWFKEYASALWQGNLHVGEGSKWQDCKWDQSFFEGKCYLYWGIVPALIRLLVPFFTNRFVCILSAAVVLFFLSKILLKLARIQKNTDEVDWLLASTTCLACFFSSGFFGMALMSRVYEESINVGHAFGLAGVFFGLSFLPGMPSSKSVGKLTLASLYFALAALTRITWLPVFALFSGFVFFSDRRKTLIPLVALALVMGFQGWLNWIRFGSPLDFGVRYQSSYLRYSYLDELGRGLLSWNFVPNFISYYFLRLFPSGSLVVLNPKGFLETLVLKNRLYEAPHTLLLTLPISFLAFFKRKELVESIKKVWSPIVSVLPLLLPTILLNAIVNRYQFEVCASFMLATIPFLLSRSATVSSKEYSAQLVANLIGISFSLYFDFELLQRFWRLL